MTAEKLTEQTTRHSVYTQRFAGRLANLFDPYLERLTRELRLIMLDAPETTQSIRRINQIVSQWRSASLAIYGDYNDEVLFEELRPFAVSESEWELASLKSVVKSPSIILVAPAPAQVWAAVNTTLLVFPDSNGAKLLEPFIKDWEKGQTEAVSNIIKTGYITGRTNQQIVQDIAGKNGYLDNQNRSSIKTMVRTATNQVSNVARRETLDENDDIVIGYQIIATLDSRTSNVCFTESTIVNSVSDIEKLFKIDYEGDIITLRFSTGEKLEGTPNHPILTQKGWTPLYKVDPAEHVVYAISRDSVKVLSDKDISVPSTFGEISNSISQTSVINIEAKSPSATDFYGDGVRMNGEVSILSVNKGLWGDRKPSIFKEIKNKLFCFVHGSISLFSSCCICFVFSGLLPAIKTAKIKSFFFCDRIKNRLGHSCCSKYINRSSSTLKKLYSMFLRLFNFGKYIPSRYVLHESNLSKKVSDCGSGGFVGFSDASRRVTVSVKPCNIIGKSSEFRSCHVYTLQTGQGYYTAGGVIVKNCRHHDQGKVFNKGLIVWSDGTRIKTNARPLPAFHPNCRSSVIAILDERFSIDDSESTRASKGVAGGKQVSATETYYTWLKGQGQQGPKGLEFVQDVLGKERGDLLVNGGLTSKQFQRLTIDELFRPIPLDKLRKKQSLQLAFDKID